MSLAPKSDYVRDQIYRLTLEDALGTPFCDGNQVEVLRNGVEIFPNMLQAIREAKRTIEFLTFIYWTGNVAKEFANALAEASNRGVQVRVLLDAFGAAEMAEDLIELMREAGAEVRWFRKKATWNLKRIKHRTHRKILVCDGKIAHTGGVGIAAEWEGNARDPSEWRDTHFRIQGPAVHGLRAGFIGNWIEAGGALEPILETVGDCRIDGKIPIQVTRSASTVGWSDVTTLLRVLILQAQEDLRITTAYFVPDEETVRLLCLAAQRGVKVTILIPGPYTDHRVAQIASEDKYEDLLKAGVKVWNYQKTMMHVKVATVDGQVSCFGSANFNQRSMRQDEEIAVVAIDAELASELNRHFDEDLQHSEEIQLKRWKKRGILQKAIETIVDPVESEM